MPKINLLNRKHSFSSLPLVRRVKSQLTKRNAFPLSASIQEKVVAQRWAVLSEVTDQSILLDPQTNQAKDAYKKNIEHFIGTVKIPVGIAGPLQINGQYAQDQFLVPLATTEAALVASYNRGSQLITAAGGATALILDEGVSRTPGFGFHNIIEAGQFVAWLVTQFDDIKAIAESTTNYGKIKDISTHIEANHVFVIFDYLTGDASGQNIVTIATNAAFNFILEHTPIAPKYAFLDANLSGDKKANIHALRGVRGKKVTADIHISRALIQKYLHTTPEKMVQYGKIAKIGGTLSGTVGLNAHYANALTALYIACGQDPACVAESAIGMTCMELNDDGGLYTSVTMPNIMVGTVGGGTHLPSQKACLDILGLAGSGNAKALAEITAVLCMAGELSLVGAFCAGHFSRAHQKLARTKAKQRNAT